MNMKGRDKNEQTNLDPDLKKKIEIILSIFDDHCIYEWEFLLIYDND